jgi:hypothetical protein
MKLPNADRAFKAIMARSEQLKMIDEVKEIWIIRDALKRGVYKARARVTDGGLAYVGETMLFPSDWSTTEEDARTRARLLKACRLMDLQLEIERIEAIEI